MLKLRAWLRVNVNEWSRQSHQPQGSGSSALSCPTRNFVPSTCNGQLPELAMCLNFLVSSIYISSLSLFGRRARASYLINFFHFLSFTAILVICCYLLRIPSRKKKIDFEENTKTNISIQ